ncbi:helix-turn-helix transcriptional regulator [Mammaliicoccus sp. N-M51]|uniref:helix-turn-helix domain-containing protein n=1 Tax=Mammaliicoccus sp. N-M51 TaxID=2898710 RepID=UPI001EFA34E1|nr:helix-turn-helix transcriptional regulator [Mammaliicoccus sp. N-M51]
MKNNLSKLLGINRLRVTELSEKTGIATSTLYSLYHEKTSNPDIKTVLKICNYFNVTLNDFFCIEQNDQKKEV